jgi:hypothetical protein
VKFEVLIEETNKQWILKIEMDVKKAGDVDEPRKHSVEVKLDRTKITLAIEEKR